MEGYDAKFDPALEKRLECPICLLAQREPMQTPCGHRFCSACILRALRETGPRCPVDNTKVYVHQLFKDNFAKREVLSLNVHCSADEYGCTWQGELRDLQLHSKHCELITIPCPNSCGHTCQRNELPPHLPSCPNRPSQCPTCSIHFPRNAIPDHQPHCSKINIPDAISSSLDKAGEVLKWVGHLKLKLNGQCNQVTGYLTAKADSEESFLVTGCWCSTISLISLNTVASRIFSRMLQGPEVQPLQLNFSLLSTDAKSVAFQKLFKKKSDNFNAAVGLRLKPGNRRESRELTIMYLHWSEPRKRVVASIANLKNHLVRQIQTHLQDMQGSRGRHRDQLRLRHRMGQAERLQRIPTHPHTHPTPHPHLHRVTQPHNRTFPVAPSHRPSHMPSHMHVQTPPQMINLQPSPPQQEIMPSLHQSQVVAAGNTPTILPNLLSWQMSQSLNTYPWRMQATGVPFFTFPSTPPQFIPANSYPYTFAPLPAAPFSISPMQPVPSSVHMPTYTGLVVPQVTAVDTAAVPLNSTQGIAATGPTQGYAMAAPPTAAVPSQAVSDRELQAVAVTLSGEGNPVLHVIRPHNGDRPDPQLHQYQGVTQPLPAPNAPPALIPTEAPAPSLASNTAQFAFEVMPQGVPHVEHSTPAPQTTHSRRHHQSLPDPALLSSPTSLPNDDTSSPHLTLPLDDSRVMWDMPGPSGLGQSVHTHSVSDTSPDSSPDTPNFPTFSPANDSDIDMPPTLDSPELFEESSESNSSLSSDQEDSPANHTESEESSETGASALHTLANAAAILASSPGPSDSSANTPQPQPSSQPVRLPVLINIPDSDSDSHMASPPSIIDLTHSPSTTASLSSSHDSTYNYLIPTTASHQPVQSTSSLAGPAHQAHPHHTEPSAVHSDSRISAVLVPVIHQWNGSSEQQGVRGLRRYLPSDQVGMVQSQMGREEGTHPMLPAAAAGALSTEVAAAAPVPLQQPFTVQDYSNRSAPVANWHSNPSEPLPPAHPVQRTLLYPPPHPPPPQPLSNRPPGDFWETVIPSLDMTLQNSTTTES